MNTTLEKDIQLELWLADTLPPDLPGVPLSDEMASVIVGRLKQEADRFWFIDGARSLMLARRIISIGVARNDPKQTALGWMACGDALRFSGQMEEAWETLERAGNIFEAAGDKVGWARTRIGRLYLAVKLSRVKETLLDGYEALKILKHAREHELLVRLNTARAVVYASLGRLQRALRLFKSTVKLAGTLGDSAQQYLGMLYMNIGVANEDLGNYSQALVYYEQAQSIFRARHEARNIVLVELNMAYIAQAQGRYRRSLQLLHGILERGINQFPMEALAVKRDMTECYLHLNRYTEACGLARDVVAGYRKCGAMYETARGLMHLATAEAELGNFRVASKLLAETEQVFVTLGATSWMAATRLKRGRLALKQGNVTTAHLEAVAAASSFEESRQEVNYGMAILLKGQALLAQKKFEEISETGAEALRIAQHYNVPSLRYAAHLLLGQLAESQHDLLRAVRRYHAAAGTIERVQRGLTITMRTGFLEDKGNASRFLIGLHIRSGESQKAFEALEHSKSQLLLGYLTNRENLHWATDSDSQALMEELNRLRAEHHWYYSLAHDPPRSEKHSSALSPEQAIIEVANRERRMRAITEQLYLQTDQQENQVSAASMRDIQRTLNEDTLLIEFYNDGTHLWAFLLDRDTVDVRCLTLTVDELNRFLGQMQANVFTALAVEPRTPMGRNLTRLGQRILQKLYTLLIEPLTLDSSKWQRLVIVPYGALHYLPFHILHDGSSYLIEKYEVVVLPSAGLATLSPPRRDRGALVLAHTWDGRLPNTLQEAQIVQDLFGGIVHVEESAKRTLLHAKPSQILHIAAHGQHRLDEPDLSYLQLADGQLFADDMLQQDLSYELVTLSACETGRANVAASDELIGLGRGFLYAGAGALLSSLWQVSDESTLHLMEGLYRSLFAGASKAAALREAQRSLLVDDRELHPAFWGAFQLIGNADPLSMTME